VLGIGHPDGEDDVTSLWSGLSLKGKKARYIENGSNCPDRKMGGPQGRIKKIRGPEPD